MVPCQRSPMPLGRADWRHPVLQRPIKRDRWLGRRFDRLGGTFADRCVAVRPSDPHFLGSRDQETHLVGS